ncbi:MAG: hypothetical protein CVU39_26230 [Chloroflexi bacterium HGW-Chloroflexi-10]|nr:MAG: hypothetical protein CVU39_26230 [Chloroflexi bacterium HGW-Chloroflexi-10]
MALDFARIKAICFDVDGTLSDTDDKWVSDFSHKLSFLKFMFPQGNLRPFARWLVMALESPGNLVYEVLDRLHLDDEAARLISWISKRRLGRKPKQFWLIPQVEEMITHFHSRYPMAVVSARDEDGTHIFLTQFNLLPHFQTVVTSQTCVYTKPFPDPVRWAAEKMGVAPEACLMVGDTTVDIRAGKAAGAQTVGVLCGFGTESELRRAGADLIVNSTAELMEILKIHE